MQYSKLRQYIRAKRKGTGVSLNEFAQKNGIEPSTLSRIENGVLEARIGTLIKIAQGFQQTLAEFFKEFEKNV